MLTRFSVIERFLRLVNPLKDIYKLPPASLHIFLDGEGPTIAFNRGGSLFLNLRYYEAWRMLSTAYLILLVLMPRQTTRTSSLGDPRTGYVVLCSRSGLSSADGTRSTRAGSLLLLTRSHTIWLNSTTLRCDIIVSACVIVNTDLYFASGSTLSTSPQSHKRTLEDCLNCFCSTVDRWTCNL